MKKLLALVCMLLFFGCNCGGSLPSKGNYLENNSAIVEPLDTAGSDIERQMNLVSYIGARTVKVHRDCDSRGPEFVFANANPTYNFDGRGTGVIWLSLANETYLITAAHVVVPKTEKLRKALKCDITVVLSKYHNDKDLVLNAKVRVFSVARDLAILSVSKGLGVSTKFALDPYLGSEVYSIGYPYNLAGSSNKMSVSQGVLATKFMPVGSVPASLIYGYYHRVTSFIYFGNSGGGVWTKDGRLVGISVALYAYTPRGAKPVPYAGQYYIKPVREVYTVLNSLNKKRVYNRSWM